MSQSSFYSREYSPGDTPTPVTHEDIPFYDINIYVYDNDAYYGDGTTMKAIAQTNDILEFKNGNLRDLVFQDKAAANNTRIVVVGTVRHQPTAQKLGLI